MGFWTKIKRKELQVGRRKKHLRLIFIDAQRSDKTKSTAYKIFIMGCCLCICFLYSLNKYQCLTTIKRNSSLASPLLKPTGKDAQEEGSLNLRTCWRLRRKAKELNFCIRVPRRKIEKKQEKMWKGWKQPFSFFNHRSIVNLVPLYPKSNKRIEKKK